MTDNRTLVGEVLPPLHAGPPATKSVSVPDASGKERRISGKLKVACDAMVWEGTPWQEAAAAANMQVRSMRKALEKPHVKSYLRQQRRDFAAAASATNLHRALQIRDQDSNPMAALHAAKAIENDFAPADAAQNVHINQSVGYIINLTPREPLD
jgi:hypothetical protein